MQVILVVWQCSDRYLLSLFPHLHTPFPSFSPSLISLMVSVDVKHHVYVWRSFHSLSRRDWKRRVQSQRCYRNKAYESSSNGRHAQLSQDKNSLTDKTHLGIAHMPKSSTPNRKWIITAIKVMTHWHWWEFHLYRHSPRIFRSAWSVTRLKQRFAWEGCPGSFTSRNEQVNSETEKFVRDSTALTSFHLRNPWY